MTPEQFCYWLQGHFELAEGNPQLSSAQIEMIKSHLALVFHKVTPEMQPKPVWPFTEEGASVPHLFDPDVICSSGDLNEVPPTTMSPQPKLPKFQPHSRNTRYC